MRAGEASHAELTMGELRNLRRLAGLMVPADAEYGVPGADDEAIFADIGRSLGRDAPAIRTALTMLQEIAGDDFCGPDTEKAEAAAMVLLGRDDPAVTALGRAVLQCYYRDDRVLRSLGRSLFAIMLDRHSPATSVMPTAEAAKKRTLTKAFSTICTSRRPASPQ